MTSQRIRVTVVHDNFVIHAGLTSTLAACDDIVVRTQMPRDAATMDCDVVVADLISGAHVLELARKLPLGTLSPRVVIVSGAEQACQIRQTLALGATAYLLLGTTCDELVSAVRCVARGGCHLTDSVSAALARGLTEEALTVRQQDVLTLLNDGLCNKHIAMRLGVSVETVKTHLRSAFERLRVRSRTEAIAAAGRRGIPPRAGLSGEA